MLEFYNEKILNVYIFQLKNITYVKIFIIGKNPLTSIQK